MWDDSKKAILETAKYLFAKNGYEGTSISSIAKRVGGTKSLIYYYFNNKEDILMEILEEGTRDIYETHSRMSDSMEEITEESMMKIMEAVADRLNNRHEIMRIMLQEFLKGTHKDNKTYKYVDEFLAYVKTRSEKYFNDEEGKMKFMLELIFIGFMPLHLYLISEDFIAEKYEFEKEKMWKVFKEIYMEDYARSLYKRIGHSFE